MIQLPWGVQNRDATERPKWRAPTWSWASLDSPVEPRELGYSSRHISVLDAWTTLAGPDPFGPVSDGTVVLAASRLVQAQRCKHDHVDYVQIQDWKNNKFPTKSLYIRWDCKNEVSVGDTVYLVPAYHGDGRVRYPRNEETRKWHDGDPQGKDIVGNNFLGLVLKPTGGPRGEFVRVGSFSYTSPPLGWQNSFESHLAYETMVLLVEEEGLDPAAEAVCERIELNANDGRRQYIISVK